MARTEQYQKYDWEIIREEVAAGQLSLKEIARRHGCSDTAIRKKIKEFGWKRNLSDRVREQVRNKLVREVRDDNANSTDEQIVEAAAERGAALVRTHREDISKLRDMELRLLAELGDENNPPTKVHVSSHLGNVTQTVLGITVTERIAALQSLSVVQHKRIQLERQAFNLDDEGSQKKQATLADILAEIDGQARSLPGGEA